MWQPLSGILSGSLTQLAGKLPPGHSRTTIPSGVCGTAATIRVMQQMVELERRNTDIRPYIAQAIQGCSQKDYLCYAQAIWQWVKSNIKYVFDPHDVEMVERPLVILSKTRMGDCDSTATLLAAMYENIDLPARFVTVKADKSNPDEFSHVFTEVQVKGKWYGADVTVPGKSFGWAPGPQYPRRVWPANPSRRSGYRDDELGSKPMVHGFAEGPIPGVTEIPGITGKEGDLRVSIPLGYFGASEADDIYRGLTPQEAVTVQGVYATAGPIAAAAQAQALLAFKKARGGVSIYPSPSAAPGMKNILIIGGVALGAYLLYSAFKGK